MGLIFLLLMWLVALLAGVVTGTAFFRLVKVPTAGLFTTWLCGMALTSAIAAWVSMVPLPLKYAWAVLVPFNLACLIWCRNDLAAHWRNVKALLTSWSPLQWGCLIVCTVAITILGYSLPQMNDAGFYHVPTITYLRHHGLITGLGNVQTRFGFNSHWHVLQAALAPHTPGYTFYGWLNGFAWLVFSTYAVLCAGRVVKGSRSLYHLYHAFTILPGYILFKNFTAPSPDLPVVLLVWHLAGLLLVNRLALVPVVILVAFALTVKASALPAVFFAVLPLLLAIKWKLHRYIVVSVIVGLFIMTPWVARNIVLSGYVVYPAANTAITSLDWTVPRQLAEEEAAYVIGASRIPGNYTLQAAREPFRVWFPQWVKYLKATNALLVLAAAACLAYWVLASIMRRDWVARYYPTLAVMAILGFGALFWFFQMPNFRFGYGYLWPIVFVTLATLFKRARIRVYYRWPEAIMVAGALLLALQTWSIRKDWFKKPDALELNTVQLNHGRIWQPAKAPGFCWDSPTPCAGVIHPGLEYRGPALSDGFRINPAKRHLGMPGGAVE